MCSDDDFTPDNTKEDGYYKKKNNKIENKSSADKTPIKEKHSCLACKKFVLNIVLHLRRSITCQPLYDMELMEEQKEADDKFKKKHK